MAPCPRNPPPTKRDEWIQYQTIPAARIARRVRLERDARDWSQADLAQRSGVSKAMISKIEREEVSPTAVILRAARRRLRSDPGGPPAARRGGGRIACRVGPSSRSGAIPTRAIVRRQVFSRPDHPLEIVQVEMPAGQTRDAARLVLRAHPPGGLGAGRRTRHRERGERHLLRAGDCLGFGAARGDDLRQRDRRTLHLSRRARQELAMSEVEIRAADTPRLKPLRC